VRVAATLAALVVLLAAANVTAGYVVHDISDTAGDSDRPSLAASPDYGLVVAWEEWPLDPLSGIWTQYLPVVPPDEGTMVEPQFHGYGEQVRVAWTWQGFILVWVNASQIHYGISDGVFLPEHMHVIEVGIPLDGGQLDVLGLTDPDGDAGWIAFTMPSVAGQMVWFLRVCQDDWDGQEEIVDGLDAPADPQVTALPTGGPPQPRVYYFQSPDLVAYQDEDTQGGWLPAQFIPPYGYGTEMDVAGRADGAQGVLSLGPQPTCPCNVIHFTLQTAAGEWLAPEPLTVVVEAMDWPMSPNVGFAPDGRAHAFWSQLGSDAELNPHHRYLEYWVRDDGGDWSDAGDFLDAYETPGVGSQVAMTLTDRGQAIFAWTRKDTVAGEPQPRRIVLARPDHVVAVPEAVPPRDRPQLDAWPNPFNPRLMLAGWVGDDRDATLSIHDLTGRLVTTLPLETAGPGQFAATWDGNDARGRPAAAGVYLARLAATAGTAVRRVVLVR
jgi:hypothetical protein